MGLLYEKESYEIRGACFTVWKELGGAHKESVVDKALARELRKRGLEVKEQVRINIYYDGEKVGTYVPDKLVNDAIILEIKRVVYESARIKSASNPRHHQREISD